MKVWVKDKGIIDLYVPDSARPNEKGEIDIICPICTPGRKPEHQKEKNLSVNLVRRKWRCNHCGNGGYFVDENYEERNRIKPISVEVGIDINPAIERWFLNTRKISKTTLDRLGIYSTHKKIHISHETENNKAMVGTYQDREVIAFPYFDDDNVIQIQYRDRLKNFALEKGGTPILYNINSIKNSKVAFWTEGMIDVASIYEAGIYTVISVPNGVTISPEEKKEYEETGDIKSTSHLNMRYLEYHYDLIESMDIHVLCVDDDAAGFKLRKELTRRLGKDKCRYVKFNHLKISDTKVCKDPNDVLVHYGPEMLRKLLDNPIEYPLDNIIRLSDCEKQMDNVYNFGMKKGFDLRIDRLRPHFSVHNGHVIIINGYAASGKTSWIIYISLILAKYNNDVFAVYCPENYPAENVYILLIECYVGNTIDKNVNDRISKDRYDLAKKFILDHFIIIDNEEGFTLTEMLANFKAMIRRYGITKCIIDPWNALDFEPAKHRDGDKGETMLRSMNQCVRFVNHTGVTLFINIHPPTPSDKATYAAPSFHSIEGGSATSKKVHEIMCVNLPKPLPGNEYSTLVEIHVQKVKVHKTTGLPTKTNPVILEYDRRSGRYLDPETRRSGLDDDMPEEKTLFNYAENEEMPF